METWFLNHVLGLSLSLLLVVGLPRPLGAGTTGSNSTDPGSYHSTSAVEVSSVENNATSSSYSSESLSPSQRNLLTHTAAAATAAAGGNFDTEETQTFTETSSRSLEISLSTEPLPSTLLVATTEASSSINGSTSSSSTRSSGSSTRSNGSSSSSSTSGSSSSSTSGSSSGSTSGSTIGSSSSSGSGSSSTSSTNSGSSSSSSGTSSGSSSTSSTNSGSSSSSSSSSSTSGSSSSSSGTSSGSTSSSTSGSSSSSSSTNSGSSSSSTNSGSSSSSSSGTSSGSSSSSSSSGSSSSSSSGTSSGSSSSSSSTSGTSSGSSSSSTSDSSSSSGWKDLGITDLVPGVSHPVSWKARSWTLTEETSLPQDNPDTTLQLRDATALASQTAILTDSTYTSSAISRAGERTLLSVTSSTGNSTSSAFTEDSNSHQPPSTWGVPAQAKETEDYTHSASSTQTDSRDATDEHMTMFSETGSPEESRVTQSLTEPPNATWHQHTSETEETSDSTTPLRVTELSTDQSDVLVSSTPPVTSPAGGPTNISGTELETGSDVGTSTEASQSFSTLNQEGTKGLSSQTREESMGPGLTTEPPTVRSNTHDMDDSLTNTPELVTEISFNTTQVPVTERSETTDTFKAFTSSTTSTTIPPLPATSSSHFSSTSSSSTSELLTKATIPYTTAPTTASTPALQTSAVHTTRSTSSSPSTESANPTNGTTLQIETGTLGGTTSHSQYVTTPNTHSTPTRSTEVLHTTGRQSGRGTTELVVTTSPADIQPTKTPPPPTRDPCVSNPCMNGGMCVSYKRHLFTCHCQQAWTGPTCNQDMDECERDPCPVGSRCVNTRGSFSCECALGFDLEDGRTCTRVKTFLGTFSFNRLPQDPVIFKSSTMHEIQREIIQLLNASLSVLQGYSRSTLSKKEEDGVRIFAVNMFSISTDVTSAEVHNSIQMSLSNCSSSTAHCRMVLHHQLTYHVESLCMAQKSQCDTERSMCTDSGGTAYCQCLQGYYKHNPEDLTCLECGDGYKLENGTCVQCMFGFGGFNCGNFYKLIAVVVSPTGGAMLLILIIALIVTCCRKDKNDINKIIFKSGDLQMSPYADFPKNNRISMEWGRETIEMQENGSTKNLLQMTDIYYSPALRNSDLERNGLYPFTGLPGSRHSCIYPAQWNPSFISDDSRRRDYF